MLFQKDKTCEHIDSLININSDYLKLFNTRLKANNLFNEFDLRAREDLMTLIKLSQERYKSVKSGNDIGIIINNQKENYVEMLNNVQSQEFYNTSAINEEKRKFLKIRNKNRNKDLIITRAKIRDNGISTNIDEKFRLNKIVESENNKNTNSINNFAASRKKSIKVANKFKFLYGDSNIDPESSPISGHDHISETNKQYSEFIEDDMKKFDIIMEDYYNHLRSLKQSVSEGETSKILKNFTFLTDDINMLSYKPKVDSNVIKVSDTDFKLDIQKLMKLSKRYKNKMSQSQKSSQQNQENQNYVPSNNDIGKGIFFTKNEILNLRNLEEILNTKKNHLEKYIEGSAGFTHLEDYEKILKQNPNGRNSRIVTEEKHILTEESHGTKNKLDQIKEEMKRTFEETKKEWDSDNIQQEKFEKLERERKMLNRHFLNVIKTKPKFYQKFVDPYSVREETLNRDNPSLEKIKNKSNKNDRRKLQNVSIDSKISEKVQKLSKNEMMENLKRNIVAETERNEDEDNSIILGSKRNEIVTDDLLRNNNISNRRKIDKIYEEFQEYKKLIIEKEEKKKEIERNLELEEKAKKYLEMLDLNKSTPFKFYNKKQEDAINSNKKRGSSSNQTSSYFRNSHVLNVPFDGRENRSERKFSTIKINSIPNVANLIVKHQPNPMSG